MVMSLSRVLWKVHSKAPTVTASVWGTVSVTGEGYTTIKDSTAKCMVNEQYNGLSIGNVRVAVVQLIRAFTNDRYPL